MRYAREEDPSEGIGRRRFLRNVGAVCAGIASAAARGVAAAPGGGRVMTVRGSTSRPVAP